MSEKYNATCAICGKPYKICRTCQEIKSFTPWRTITDTLQHYTLFLVLSEYSRTKDKAKAKDELLKCDLSEKESFKDSVKNMIDEIMKEDVIKIIEDEQNYKNIYCKKDLYGNDRIIITQVL